MSPGGSQATAGEGVSLGNIGIGIGGPWAAQRVIKSVLGVCAAGGGH